MVREGMEIRKELDLTRRGGLSPAPAPAILSMFTETAGDMPTVLLVLDKPPDFLLLFSSLLLIGSVQTTLHASL